MILADAGTGGERLGRAVGDAGRARGVRHFQQQFAHQIFQPFQHRLRLIVAQGECLDRTVGLGQRAVAQEHQR
ncbi:hypothetical protein D3C79_998850 [compost metagenome]